MPDYKKFHSFSKLADVAARRIDDLYCQSPRSKISKAWQATKARLIFAFSFIPRIMLDMITSFSLFSYFKVAGWLSSHLGNQKNYKGVADKQIERFKKSSFAFLASPLGLINPKVVAFYFIPKREKYGNIISGNHIDAVHPEIQYPKTIEELQAIVRDADKTERKITVIGAGRSQGQQFLPTEDNAIVISMKYLNQVHINPKNKTVNVGAGATWSEVQLKANVHQLAVKVMQASNVFSIGGSISTNIHGWRKEGTLAETIKSLTIIDAKGDIKVLTPQDDLFGYVIGGYNQFGIIVTAEIELTDNEKLAQKSIVVNPSDYVGFFKKNVLRNNNNRMHLYRLSLDPNHLLKEGVAVNYITTDKTHVKSSDGFHLEPKNGTRIQRIFVNLARRFSWIRKWYWRYEKDRLIQNEPQMTTNEIMQPAINGMFNHSLSESEWLQEFFLPEEKLATFLEELSALLTESEVKLLNATVRYVKQDSITKMGYANAGDRFAVVLCFNQLLNEEALLKAKQWIRQASELALKNGGTYYLPYQQFPTQEQFLRGYPTAPAVYAKKLEVDPKKTFSSGFSSHYLEPQSIVNNPYHNLLAKLESRELFGRFLDNILDRVDKQALYTLLDDITKYCDTPDEIYFELSKRVQEIMPNPISSTRRILRSLANIKHDLGEQAVVLMKKDGEIPAINGLIEIGYPGRFVQTFKNKMDISGKITVMHDAESMSDIVQSGFPKPYDRFIPLKDYAPLEETLFKDNSVDLITCFVGLHHISEDRIEDFLVSLNRVLRPGGCFLLVDHNITDPLTLDMATLAHSVYNAVMGASVEEERNEIRHFKPLAHWIDLLAKYGLRLDMTTDKEMVRNGDPTKNTMLRFVKTEACQLKKQAKNDDIDHLIEKRAEPIISNFKEYRVANESKSLSAEVCQKQATGSARVINKGMI